MSLPRRRSIGAEIAADGVSFRVWAPAHRRVSVVLEDRNEEHELSAEEGGYFSATVKAARAGSRYRFRLGRSDKTYPDPASRFQPDGPHESSQVIDPSRFRWTDRDWRGLDLEGAVIYEMHFGTFTQEGTYRAAIEKLPLLADVGVSVLEIMPVNEFPGAFGWGYDGVDLWAPAHIYGTPDDLRAFVDAAHSHGLAFILDVVYNHFGPDGCYLEEFSPLYFTTKYKNDWGKAVNFDGEGSEGVREFFSENAAYWIEEFHLDGFRIDATQSIFDESEPNILKVIADRARAAAPQRKVLVIAENEPQDVRLLNDYGFDAMWNDDWHHSSHVVLTRTQEAYYTDYNGKPQEFVSMARLGFLYQGQRYKWQKNRRGTSSREIEPPRLVTYLENHDQIANSARGDRIHQLSSAGLVRAMTALMLLSPQTPMLFQGQEFAASAPFLYFADHKPELAKKVREGRGDFLAQFPSIKAIRSTLADPGDRKTFEVSKLDFSERDRNRHIVDLHRDLIRLRRTDPLIREQRRDNLHGAVIGPDAFVLRWMPDRLLVINLGGELKLDPAPEPLLAAPERWRVLWSSDDEKYGGSGATNPESDDGRWCISAESAVLLG